MIISMRKSQNMFYEWGPWPTSVALPSPAPDPTPTLVETNPAQSQTDDL